MILPPAISDYAKQKGLSEIEATQVFFQIIVLKNMRWKDQFVIGGTALVLGHQNPRFSEDIDLAGIPAPSILQGPLNKAARELGVWLQSEIKCTPPKSGAATWKLAGKFQNTKFIRLHVDSQPYSCFSKHPLIVHFPGIPPFTIPSATIDEIMADKLVALAHRAYVGGRDIFDLWFHWFRESAQEQREVVILNYLNQKVRQRKIPKTVLETIDRRLDSTVFARAWDEWQRYLPVGLRDKSVFNQAILSVQAGIHRLRDTS